MSDISATYSRDAIVELIDRCDPIVNEYSELKAKAKARVIEKNRSENPETWKFWPFIKRLRTDNELYWLGYDSACFREEPILKFLEITNDKWKMPIGLYIDETTYMADGIRVYDRLRVLVNDPDCQTVTLAYDDMAKLKRLSCMRLKEIV